MPTQLLEDIHTGIDTKHREKIVESLSKVLANQHVLYLKTRNFHWNLTGPRFHTLHEFYEDHYEGLAQDIDETAERIRMVGGVAPGSMKSFLATASLEEAPDQLIHGDDSIRQLVHDHEACARELREAIPAIEEEQHDIGTADFLTTLLQKHEEHAWMLRSFLAKA